MGRRIKLTNATKTVTRGHGDGETRGNANFLCNSAYGLDKQLYRNDHLDEWITQKFASYFFRAMVKTLRD
jgi:hypothetical protein